MGLGRRRAGEAVNTLVTVIDGEWEGWMNRGVGILGTAWVYRFIENHTTTRKTGKLSFIPLHARKKTI